MKILITGGAGFIGSHIQDAFISEGHDVTVIDNFYTGRENFIHPDCRFYEVDICNKDAILDLFKKEQFDIVNHHAAQMDVRASVSDPMFDANINIIGGLNLLEAAIKTGVKQFIFASTGGAIYGDQDYFPADERHELRPVSPYGIAKLSLEKYLYYYHKVHGLRYFILRYANIYGPRQNPHGEAGVIAIFSQKLVKGETPTINGNGKQTRDFVHVNDVVKANLAALDYPESMIVNIGTGIETDINTVFKHLALASGNTVAAHRGPAMKGEQLRSVLDNTLAKEILGWTPEFDIKKGLKHTYQYFR